jgi:hypothetical protein
MKKGLAGLIAMSFALAGCYQAQKPSLSVKPHGAYARVRITYVDERSIIGVFGNRDCGVSHESNAPTGLAAPHMTTREALTLLKPASTSLGMPKTAKTPRVYYEYYIEANEPALINVSYDASSVNPNVYMVRNARCTRTAVFVPIEGKNYEIGPTGTCAATVKELIPGSGGHAADATAVDAPVRMCDPI